MTYRHREWVRALPDVSVPTVVEIDGTPTTKMLPFDKKKIFPYAYRHTYAQRHADAGIPVDVLRDLMNHRQLSTTQHYYRVGKAINTASVSGEEVSVSAIARAAGVDRTFLYRHADLPGQIHAAQAGPTAADGGGPAVSRASLQADLANAHGQITRQAARVRQLENKLSELLGEQAWRESGLGAPTDIDQLQRRITDLEQQVVDLRNQLEERDSKRREPPTETSSPT